MRPIFWVAAFAVLSIASAKNSTAKTKPKRQLDNIRTPQNLQYSLVLPHSRVANFRALTSNRRISNVSARGGRLPPYAVQMEPVVQYSQKDPLYDPNHDNLDNPLVNKNEIYAQAKILNVNDQDADGSYGPPFGTLPTAPLYSNEPHPHYIDEPEPIIEIIIKESNESLPAPPLPLIQKKKKEPVQVFYVKYSKDPHSHDKVVYEKPIPAITPSSNDEDDHHDEYVTVTPEPYYIPSQTTTIRAIIKPESGIYHSDSKVKITFGDEGRNYGNRREENSESEANEETAPRPAIALPSQQPSYVPLERSASQYQNVEKRPFYDQSGQSFQSGQRSQNRIQFQQPYINNEPQLPRQGQPSVPFRTIQNGQTPRQNIFPHTSPIGPRPSYSGVSPSPSNHFANIVPTIPGPISPSLQTFSRPSNSPQLHSRVNNPQILSSRQHFNGPPRSFHSGPQRPFYQQQGQTYFDDPKYLQENYHTITTDQVDPPKLQLGNNRPTQNINFDLRPNPSPSSTTTNIQNHSPSLQLVPYNQQLPQQRQPIHFNANQNKPSFQISPRPPFYNLKPSPPQIENNRPPFVRQQSQPQPQHQVSFHQGIHSLSRPTFQESNHEQNTFTSFVTPSPATVPQTQFLPQPSATPLFNFNSQISSAPIQNQNFHQQSFPSQRPQFSHSQTERPQGQNTVQFHQQNIAQFVPNGGELVAAIPKYEQHITETGPTAQPNFNEHNNLKQPTPTSSNIQQQYQPQEDQQQYVDPEQEQVKLQLAQNVRKQQDEIQQLQAQLAYAQHQHHQQQQQQQQHQHQQQQYQQQQQQQLEQHQQQQQQNNQAYNRYNQQDAQSTSPSPQYIQERARPQYNYVTNTETPQYYQSTSRTVEIKPTTQKYVSSAANSISSTPEPVKEEKKNKPSIVLPDEVPDDLRQQLLSSGILDNADISVLDYDKVGETPLESLPPDQLANFFSAGGGQQIAASEQKPVFISPNGENIESRIDDDIDDEDQEIAASENIASYIMSPSTEKQSVEMKVVHFDPKTLEGQKIASDYVKEDATQVEPVALNDKKYNRYLPLKVSGNQFPLPDILKGKKITSVVVLAPVKTEALKNKHTRNERAASENLREIKFVAGDSLHDLLKKPTKDNFKRWLDIEKKTATDQQSVVLLVTGKEDAPEEREIFMYDVVSENVNKLSGGLSNAFVEAAENNALSKDIEKLAIEGDGTPEDFNKDTSDETIADSSDNVPLLVDLSGVRFDEENNNQISISSGYSKTKHGRAIRRQ